MNRVASLCIGLLLVFLSSCSKEQASSPISPQPPRSLTTLEKQLVSSSSSFGLALFAIADQADPKANVVLSPVSVSMALGMTLNGARTSTESAMRSTLGFSGMTAADINASYRGLLDFLRAADPAVTMKIANSIWHRPELTVLPAFLDANSRFFDAQVQPLDFSQPDAADVINAWVKSHTGNKIESIVPKPIPDYAVMYLINALYFKAPWTLPFDPKFTAPGSFTTPTGVVQHPLMRMHDSLRYAETDDIQAVDLRYGAGPWGMTVILPKDDAARARFVNGLTPASWDALRASFSEKEGYLWLPKFSVTYDKTLNDMLKALGMEIAFSPNQADFTGIDPAGALFISNVKHKTFIEVTEEGTEASGATSVEIGRTSIDPNIFQMYVTRPFLFVIHEKASGAILFIGRISDPRQ